MRRLVVIWLGLFLAAAAAAEGAGGPVPAQQLGAGVSPPGGSVNYVAASAGGGRTLVERVRRAGGVVERARLVRGIYGIPGVAYDGSNTGVSVDEHTLVLAEIPIRTTRTRLLVLDARRLKPHAHVTLPGYFTVDAISPDGRWLYLIHYRSVRDTTHYEVRAYDLRARKLVSRPVIDPREPDEKMQGIPVTRTASPDGRWAYTLYQRPKGAPFIHALDTESRTAACIDLDGLAGDSASELRLALSGRTLRVEEPAGPVSLVDTKTFAVREPRGPARLSAPRHSDGGGVPWALAFVALVPLAGIALVARRRRRATLTR